MNSAALAALAIGLGVLHIVALHRRWGWFINNYQVRGIRKSMGETGLRLYTYVTCGMCIGFGLYILVTGGPPFS